MQQREGSFLEPKTIFAIILVGVVWFAWQSYLTKKYPEYGKPKAVEQKKIDSAEAPAPIQTADQKQVSTANPNETSAEKLVKVENQNLTFEISTRGMGIKNLNLKKFKDREGRSIGLGQTQNEGLFETKVNNQTLHFTVSEKINEKSNERVFEGTAALGDIKITRQLQIDDGYAMHSSIFIEDPQLNLKSVEVFIPEKKMQAKSGNFLSPATDIQEFLYGNSGKLERVFTSAKKEDIEKALGPHEVGGVSSHYFTTAIVNLSEIAPNISLQAIPDATEVSLVAEYRPVTIQKQMEFKSLLFVGPKDLSVLEGYTAQLGKDITPILNFGFFGSIGKVLLKTLQFFYNSIFPNWGLAIILLTLLVRFIVLPFNVFSYKSMKRMQVIQPMIQSLRERYKEEPQKLNTEMMKLMKDQKVNPLGGCLPMLLQMPVFFALYQVLGQSIELYQAPFFGWIHDLSLKDPYFILPILMGISMWYNQKITPTTMDPTQAKVMQFLPLVFSLMMIALPSGLTLYIFVSTLFGIIQQQIFMKDRTKTGTSTI